MKINFLLLWLPSTVCHLIPSRSQHTKCRNSSIKWNPCNEAISSLATVPVQCGHLIVPLDYTDKDSNTTMQLELIRVPATGGERASNGSILYNWGGPGATGLEAMAMYAEHMLNVTGGYNDLISFNPRGTGDTLSFTCYENEAERTQASSRVPEYVGDASSTSLARLWAHSQIVARKCYTAQSDNYGSLVGTAFVVRDMMRIVDALNEDGMLRFWGVSYGSTLGATAAAMFPERVDKIVLDGILDPVEYYHSYDLDMLARSDEAASGFFSACITAGPEACALARHNLTGAELESTMFNLFNDLKSTPIPAGDYIIDYSQLISFFLETLYTPITWSEASTILDLVLTRDTAALAGVAETIYTSGAVPEANAGIKCGDKLVRMPDLQSMHDVFRKLALTSKWFGTGPVGVMALCAQWKMEAKERYMGDFKVHTENPLLILGNTYDPVTPIDSARKLGKLLRGSVVEQNGFGHTSLAQKSHCIEKIVRQYFVEGTLPRDGIVCPVDEKLFSS